MLHMSNLNASIRYDVAVVPELGFDFHIRVTDVRLTSVTSGLDGALGIRLGSTGWLDCTTTPNSAQTQEERG